MSGQVGGVGGWGLWVGLGRWVGLVSGAGSWLGQSSGNRLMGRACQLCRLHGEFPLQCWNGLSR